MSNIRITIPFTQIGQVCSEVSTSLGSSHFPTSAIIKTINGISYYYLIGNTDNGIVILGIKSNGGNIFYSSTLFNSYPAASSCFIINNPLIVIGQNGTNRITLPAIPDTQQNIVTAYINLNPILSACSSTPADLSNFGLIGTNLYNSVSDPNSVNGYKQLVINDLLTGNNLLDTVTDTVIQRYGIANIVNQNLIRNYNGRFPLAYYNYNNPIQQYTLSNIQSSVYPAAWTPNTPIQCDPNAPSTSPIYQARSTFTFNQGYTNLMANTFNSPWGSTFESNGASDCDLIYVATYSTGYPAVYLVSQSLGLDYSINTGLSIYTAWLMNGKLMALDTSGAIYQSSSLPFTYTPIINVPSLTPFNPLNLSMSASDVQAKYLINMHRVVSPIGGYKS